VEGTPLAILRIPTAGALFNAPAPLGRSANAVDNERLLVDDSPDHHRR